MENFKFPNDFPTSSVEREIAIQKIGETLKEGVEALTVHGTEIKRRDGKRELALRPDLDAMSALYLMDLAKIDYKAAASVPKGGVTEGGIHIDTGGREDTTLEDDGSIFFDHHGKEKGTRTSATALVYETLVKNGLLERKEWLDRFVHFVTEIDNADYPIEEKFFKNGWAHTLYGTYKGLTAEVVAERFKAGEGSRSSFTMDEKFNTRFWENGRSIPLGEACKKMQDRVNRSVRGVEQCQKIMSDRAIKTETEELGQIVVNMVKKEGKIWVDRVPLGYKAVRAMNLDTYIKTDGRGFFLTSRKANLNKIYPEINREFPEALIVRGTMILCRLPEGKTVDFDKLLRILDLTQ